MPPAEIFSPSPPPPPPPPPSSNLARRLRDLKSWFLRRRRRRFGESKSRGCEYCMMSCPGGAHSVRARRTTTTTKTLVCSPCVACARRVRARALSLFLVCDHMKSHAKYICESEWKGAPRIGALLCWSARAPARAQFFPLRRVSVCERGTNKPWRDE
jgi:Pyruvate/2-oxoacid:ferredoxin oxidoreductase delta subunit